MRRLFVGVIAGASAFFLGGHAYAQFPSPEPTPTPTPTPDESILDDCANGIDDDGDTFVDGDDPGCALDGNEASA